MDWFAHMSLRSTIWCRLRGKHTGEVGYFTDTGAFWICDNCGLILRDREE